MDKNKNKSKERRRYIAESFSKLAAKKEAFKIKGNLEKDQTVWFGLGMFGVVGWSVAIPTLIGIGLGLWIDQTLPSRFSWTLMLLVAGVTLGCMNAWYWVKKSGISNSTEDRNNHKS